MEEMFRALHALVNIAERYDTDGTEQEQRWVNALIREARLPWLMQDMQAEAWPESMQPGRAIVIVADRRRY
ncbi:hypothetical protein SEA_LATRETIUM_43 [Mycobacterium phage Latretium]|uniref:Uncharacterized protein n=1 Tax=Mycobacterium phage Kersh TaxID=1897501 RepID=A0A1D8EXQ5_9CAUD|nr:hypothetical protein I5H52_gp041 [Mycobacterium phage Kersh]AOT26027.1 hypothetical protein SEA_KERSH_41 [Mycobacterium phage Kersh]QXO12843.1 hypothetical protein SEA_LATRETIUM_43 [Mycobacterium phage Latretium]UVK60490.1 hypothetical protein SEA_SABBB_46 [Mycobacterium phage Sabbb]